MKKEEFFKRMEWLGIALTYDDVRLKTGYSEVMPDNVNLDSKFSRNVPLRVPIVAAAMDTVTEYKMAVEMAKHGGIGVLHKSLSIEEQAKQVARVKNYLNAKILKPVCVEPEVKIQEVIDLRNERGYEFQTFPVVDKNQKLLGIVTRNDFEMCSDNSQLVKQVMTTNPITASADTGLEAAFDILQKQKKKVLPLIDKDGKISGMYVYTDISRILLGNGSPYNVDKNNQLIVAAAISVGKAGLERAEKLIEKHVDVLVLDTAHGDSKPIYETIKSLKSYYPNVDIVAGNISEPESAKRLADAGVDGIKVGQGPGSICTTRKVAGIGCPQVTAIYNCTKAVEGSGIPICADGGLVYSGDITIAIGAGAHSVMMGSMLAGTDESPGKKIYKEGRHWKTYRGMGSMGAMENPEARARYNQKDAGKSDLIPEGIEGRTPYKGDLKTMIHQYIGGFRHGMGYVGAADIEELRTKGNFWRLSTAGQIESHPHNVVITEEAPNYQTK